MLQDLYNKYILKYPKLILSFVGIFVIIMTFFVFKLEIDASAETLLLEGDKDLEFTREISKRFTSSNILIVTYTIEDELLSQTNINNIKDLTQKLLDVEVVNSINSIVNVPLLQSPPKPIKDLVEDIHTLETAQVSQEVIKKEFLESPIYSQNLVSKDFQTTALSLNLKRDETYFDLLNARDSFIELKKERTLTKEEQRSFDQAKTAFKKYRDILREQNHNAIMQIREILQDFQTQHPQVKLHLGGVNMIADDLVEFVKSDLKTFGFLIIFLLIIVLYKLLKKLRWVMITLLICSVSLIITSGILGLFGWEITVVSSNFISLQLIMNISLVVHLIVKYKELRVKYPTQIQRQLIIDTLTSMAKPSFFVVITTIAGFSSLVFSNILPIINFGWMMSIGLIVSLLTTFILFPIILLYFDTYEIKDSHNTQKPFTAKIAHVAYHYRKTILMVSFFVVIFSITGAQQLKVENSFIDYFKKDTQIYQGMALIDQKLGGTTPLDVIITFKENSDTVESIDVVEEDIDEEFDDFSEEFEETQEDKERYWFTQAKLQKIKQVHDYLDSLEPVGKVLSLSTMGEIIKILENTDEVDSLTLALLYKELPQEYKKIILSPYLDIKNNQVRISSRVIDSQKNLQRDQLIKKIQNDLNKILNPRYEEYRVSNLLVIYNNMLQSLFNSQIKTIGIVVFILFMMFLILFKSLKLATIAIIANTVPVGVIFGFMGWLNIPLDMMTITIAAISIGIAVDDTIHYIHRFNLEYKESNDIKKSLFNAHASIGTAMFYTSTIIMVGFSILVLSNFIPTIYFGLLTMVAMFMAIASDLLLLPVLLLLFYKPKQNQQK